MKRVVLFLVLPFVLVLMVGLVSGCTALRPMPPEEQAPAGAVPTSPLGEEPAMPTAEMEPVGEMEPVEPLTTTEEMTGAMEPEEPAPMPEVAPTEALTATEEITGTAPGALPTVAPATEQAEPTAEVAVVPTSAATPTVSRQATVTVGEADAEADAAPGLFINLTTDDTWSAAMALSFAQQALDNDYEPVTVWLNVRAVYLADSNRPPHTHGMLDSNMHQMMRQFMQNGGRILACPTCTEAAGLTPDDYIDGVEMGEPSIVLPLLSDENTQTLAW